LGNFNHWRMLHIILGTALLLILGLHTGLQLGSNLNFVLILVFLTVAFTGALASAVVAMEPRMTPGMAKRARWFVNQLHLVMFWPLPVLLTFHIISFYYF
jgi:nitrite reductase (NADH) large subunit